jgi:hypothetical protein
MMKVAYDYGCFEGCVEYSGETEREIRDSLKFPKTHSHDPVTGKDEVELELGGWKSLDAGPWYYLDINSCYLSCATDIQGNTRISELIQKMYSLRNSGSPGLCTTLKCMMNSLYGYSFKKPKLIKHKFVRDIEKYYEMYSPIILSASGDYVDTLNCIVVNYTFPDFAQGILTNYFKKIEEITQLVDGNVWYYNIDAVLVDQTGYDKLSSLGMVGKDLGQLKIEKVFKWFKCLNGRKKFLAETIEGEKVFHCVKK